MKVHLAGHLPFQLAYKKAGVRYILDTFYEIKQMGFEKRIEHLNKMAKFKHAIVDSGLFTLMFGAKAGYPITEQFIIDWQNDYANTINSSNFKHSIVECDVQRVLSSEFAWEMRKRFRKQLKDDVTLINVYHLPDGNPDKLIDHADYIAVSIPELRKFVSKKERDRITEYIAKKATSKGKRVHLLGCTEKEMMKKFSYCFSCDSTSWISGGRYNNHQTELFDEPMKINQMRKNRKQEFSNNSYSDAYYQVITKMVDYRKYAGDQS
jgi:hypothetical protein